MADDIIGQYGMVICDECHHLSAFSFETVIRQCKCQYVLGLSATLTRKDGHHPIIFMQCGPVRYRVNDKQQASERTFDHQVKVRETSLVLPQEFAGKDKVSIHDIYNLLPALGSRRTAAWSSGETLVARRAKPTATGLLIKKIIGYLLIFMKKPEKNFETC